MKDQMLSKTAIDWARTSTPQELKAKLIKHIAGSISADHIALFTLNFAQDRLYHEQSYPPVHLDETINIILDDQDNPIAWTLRSGQDLYLENDASFAQFSISSLNKIWTKVEAFRYAYFLCMSQTATYPDTIIVILNQKVIEHQIIKQQKDFISLAEGLLANIFARMKSEQNLKSALIQNEKQKERIENIIDNQSVLTGNFIYKSQKMKDVHDNLKKVANTQMTVCLQGETGVGKDVAANELHRISDRSKFPFVAINCAAIPKDLLESELFGFRKGSHSNALSDYDGLFIQAGSGTIFLDEISEMPEGLQAKLLRVLQNKTVRPIGANRDFRLDCRIVVATNQNLQKRVKQKLFREDLYYRLSQFTIHIPPLRERKEDIAPLVQYFIKDINQKERFFIKGIKDEAIQWIQQKELKGNVRELRYMIERAALDTKSGSYIDLGPLKAAIKNNHDMSISTSSNEDTDDNLSYKKALAAFETKLLKRRLSQYGGKKGKAAKSLDMPSRTFYDRCKKLNLLE